jgi:hypothetical protein
LKTKKKIKKLKRFEAICQNLKDVPSYCCEYHCEYYYPCQNGSDCCEGDYCRCSQITSSEIKEIYPYSLEYHLHNSKTKYDIVKYCLDRVIRSEMLSPSAWKIIPCSGYYGEEISSIQLNNYNQISNFLLTLDKVSNIQKLKTILNYEYGFLLPEIEKAKTYKTITVNLDRVKLNNTQYIKKVSKEPDYYSFYNYPRAICFREGPNFRVVDGYHRVISAQKNLLKTIPIIVLK